MVVEQMWIHRQLSWVFPAAAVVTVVVVMLLMTLGAVESGAGVGMPVGTAGMYRRSEYESSSSLGVLCKVRGQPKRHVPVRAVVFAIAAAAASCSARTAMTSRQPPGPNQTARTQAVTIAGALVISTLGGGLVNVAVGVRGI